MVDVPTEALNVINAIDRGEAVTAKQIDKAYEGLLQLKKQIVHLDSAEQKDYAMHLIYRLEQKLLKYKK